MINIIKNNVDHIVLMLVAAGTIITALVYGIFGFAIAVFPAVVLYYYAHKWQIAREMRLLKQKYARQVDDIFVYAEDEQDDTVKARAMEEVHLLKDSRNAEYAAGKLKVIILYYEHNPIEDMEEVVAMSPINAQLHRYLVMAPSFDRYCELAQEWAHRHHGNAHKAKAADRFSSDWAEAEILKQRG